MKKRKYVYGDTQKEATTKLRALQQQQRDGVQLDQPKLTVAAFLEHWLRDHVQQRCRPNTIAGYTMTVQRHIVPAIGGILLDALGARDVERMVNGIAKHGKRRTAQYTRSVLSRALNKALRWGLVSRNVAALAEAPPHEAREGITLTPDQARAFLAAVAGDRWEAAYWLLLGAGLRRGEVLGLRLVDLDLDAGELHITGSLSRITGEGLVRGPTKTKTSMRTIPLSSVLVDRLRQRLEQRAADQAAAKDAWKETGFLFTTSVGTAILLYNFHREFKRMLARAGLPNAIRIHDLRHSFVSLALAEGADARSVADLAGHADVSITLNRYAHSLAERRRSAASSVTAMLVNEAGESSETVTFPVKPQETGLEPATGCGEGVDRTPYDRVE